MVSKISSLLFGALLILASVQQSPAQNRTPSDAANPNKPTEFQLLKGLLEEVRFLDNLNLIRKLGEQRNLSLSFDALWFRMCSPRATKSYPPAHP